MGDEKLRTSSYRRCLNYTALLTLLVSLAFLIAITFNISDILDLNEISDRHIKITHPVPQDHIGRDLAYLLKEKAAAESTEPPADFDFVDGSSEQDKLAEGDILSEILKEIEKASKDVEINLNALAGAQKNDAETTTEPTQTHEPTITSKTSTTTATTITESSTTLMDATSNLTTSYNATVALNATSTASNTPSNATTIALDAPSNVTSSATPSNVTSSETPLNVTSNLTVVPLNITVTSVGTNSTNVTSSKVESSTKPMVVEIFDNTFFRPWYFFGGERRPPPARRRRRSNKRLARIFPVEDAFRDRITNQLMFVPPDYKNVVESGKHKTILLHDGLEPWRIKSEGNFHFTENECPVYTCNITVNHSDADRADLIFFRDRYEPIDTKRTTEQIYALYWRESPPYANLSTLHHVFNWTANYRMDSTIVDPSEKWELYDTRTKQIDVKTNFAENKSKKVAWYVSECDTYNNRMEYVKELEKYIQIDIYGPCGSLQCPQNKTEECNKLFDQDYKFILAFEKSNCRDYITDEFYSNLIHRNIVPVVMGAHPEDYQERAPYHSYIHIDHFKTPKDLADYLNVLDRNDELYNFYFKWKGTGEFIDTKFMCRVCALLHDDYYFTSGLRSSFDDIKHWWDGPGICTSTDWKENSNHTSVADEACGVMEGLLGQ